MTTERLTPLTDLESDALAELANVAMARASVSLRTMIQHEVLLSVPNVEILAPKEAVAKVAKPGNPNLVAVRQDFSGVFSGRALLIFPEASSLELVRVVVGRQLALEDIVDLEDEALAETGNIILNSWVATIANLLKKNLKMSLPVVIRRDQSHIFESASPRESLILFLHIKFDISRQQIRRLRRLDDGRSVGRRAPIADCRLRGKSRRPRRLIAGRMEQSRSIAFLPPSMERTACPTRPFRSAPMSQPDVRKGMPPRRLERGTFEQKFKSAFVEPALSYGSGATKLNHAGNSQAATSTRISRRPVRMTSERCRQNHSP